MKLTQSPDLSTADDPSDEEMPMWQSSRLLFVGLGLIVLSLLFSWWSVSKDRVYEERGVDLGSRDAREAITAQMSEDDKRDYQNRVEEYSREWQLNTTRFDDFYQALFGKDFQVLIAREEQYTRRTGTLSLRGWSTWTGLIGLVVAVAVLAVPHAPKWDPEWAAFAWTFPLVQAALTGLFWFAAVVFYFTVPDANGTGYSQGVGLGNYLAIAGATLVLAITVREGVRSAAQHKAEMADDVDDDEDEESSPVATNRAPEPPKPAKNRLQDW